MTLTILLIVAAVVAIVGSAVYALSRRRVRGGNPEIGGDDRLEIDRTRTVKVPPARVPPARVPPAKVPGSTSDGATTKGSTDVGDLSDPSSGTFETDPTGVSSQSQDDEDGFVEREPIGERPRFRDRLSKARGLLDGYFGSVLGRSAIDADTWDELEEALIRADVGVAATTNLLADLRVQVKRDGIKSSAELLEVLKADLKKRLFAADRDLRFEPGKPNLWLFVGVNGVGKTTTIGKIGRREVAAGKTVLMAAGDTFRAAAAEQLNVWSDRVGAQFVRGAEGGDPGSVIFDGLERAAARKIDLVLGDTAGRLQTKTNLMEELRKIRRIAEKSPGVVTEVLLVLDATTGQNGLVQAKQFSDVAELTGVVLTKLDGTAKGGIALAIQTELGIPIKLVGLGEGPDDLVVFDPDEYVEALFN